MTKKSKNLKTIEDFKLQALFKKFPTIAKQRIGNYFIAPRNYVITY